MTTLSRAAAAPTTDPDPDERTRVRMLAVIVVAQFATASAIGAVVIALPSIQDDLGAGPAAIQWVLLLYQLAFALVLITGGRLGDIHGPKRMFVVGFVGFVGASALGTLAPTVGVLLGARLLQGLFAGLAAPQVLAMIQLAFSQEARAKAMGAYAGAGGVGFVSGQVISGLLVEGNLFGMGWRSTFAIYVPIGLLLLAGASTIPSVGGTSGRQRLDVRGVLLVSLGILLVLYPMIEGRSAGWPPLFLLMLAAAGPVLYAFARRQRALTGLRAHPLIDTGLFRTPGFVFGLGLLLVFAAIGMSTIVYLVITLQFGFGFGAWETALATAPSPFFFMVGSLSAGRIVPRVGTRTIAGGAALTALGTAALLAMLTVGPDALRPVHLLPVLVLVGLGHGLISTPVIIYTLSRVQREHAGAASGVLKTFQQVSSALGIAIFGVIFFAALAGRDSLEAHTSAFQATMLPVIGLCAILFFLHHRLAPADPATDTLRLPAAPSP